jgi:ribonuclease R
VKEQLLELLGAKGYFPADAAELARQMELRSGQVSELGRVLDELEHAGRIARIKGNRYILPEVADLIPGRIRMNRQGKGYLTPDQKGVGEVEIPESATGTALHEDRVLVRRDVRPQGLRPGGGTVSTGVVVRVLERRRTQIVGTLERSRHFLYVVPDDPRIPHDIYVPEPRDVGRRAYPGDKVVVELREWLTRQTQPEGEVVEVLGPPDAEGVDMMSVLRQYDLPLRFPRAVLDEARRVGTTVTAGDLEGREDCRGHRVVTIDPDDAKDFDDAISVERGERGGWRVWVHIADVSHYVRPGSLLDATARRRGNSTYLVDRVIPMLPEALSNELCSLKPGVDRLTKCVEFRIDDAGRVLQTRFYPAVIHSKRRFTYQEALAILQRQPADPLEDMVHRAHRLAQVLRRERFKAGSLELDFPEMKIRLDERGRVQRIERTENDISHQLIEEYMLLANEAVAARLMSLKRPAIYRVHEAPDERRLREYREDVLGHGVACGNLAHRVEVQRLLHRLNDLPIGPALKIGFLKSLMRARYAVEPLGHFGLAKAKYTHFTSPIRRYADLVVHRALFDAVAAKPSALAEIADHLSMTERNSADAERDSKDVKLFAYLRAQLESGRPEIYPALVTDVRNFGFFVDVPGLAMSGLVPLSTMEDDFYVFDAARGQVVGRRTRRVIRLGDRPSVQVAKVNAASKQVDFRLVQVKAAAPSRTATGAGAGTGVRAGAATGRRTEVPPAAAHGRRKGGEAPVGGGGRFASRPKERNERPAVPVPRRTGGSASPKGGAGREDRRQAGSRSGLEPRRTAGGGNAARPERPAAVAPVAGRPSVARPAGGHRPGADAARGAARGPSRESSRSGERAAGAGVPAGRVREMRADKPLRKPEEAPKSYPRREVGPRHRLKRGSR